MYVTCEYKRLNLSEDRTDLTFSGKAVCFAKYVLKKRYFLKIVSRFYA